MKTNHIQTSFNAGETSPEIDGRIDLAKYANSCSRMENFYPLVQGPARRRPGTKFINAAKDRGTGVDTWLHPFVFNRDNAYMMEMGNGYTRFHTSEGTVLDDPKNITGATQANPCVITAVAHGYSTGHWVWIESVGGMTQLNNKFYEIVVITPDTFSLKDSLTGAAINSTAYTAYTAGGTSEKVTEIGFGAADHTDGSCSRVFAQIGDIVYATDKGGTFTRKITRTAANAFSAGYLDPNDGPFEDIDPDNTITVYSSARTGIVTLTASSAIFDISIDAGAIFLLEQKNLDDIEMWEPAKGVLANDIRRSDGKNYRALANGTTGTIKPVHSSGTKYDGDGGVQWEYRDAGFGIVRINTVGGGGTTASCDVLSPIPDGAVLAANASTRWAKSDWYKNGWPTHVTFFRDRLVLARSSDAKLWFSVAGDYESFADRDDGGVVTADMAITIQLASEQPQEIKWMAPADGLVVGTAGPEFVVSEITTNDVFGPGNVKAEPQTYFGSTSISPARIGNTMFFVQGSGRKLREIAYSFESDGLASVDLTRLSPRMIPRSKALTQITYQQEPNSIIWCVRNDGVLVGFTYNREEEVFGWHRHAIGGSSVSVKSAASMPSADGGRDELWLSVTRTINGTVRNYIEIMQDDWDSSLDLDEAWYVDCGLSYSGSATTTITGLDHLEGQTVAILADGATHPTRTVSGGSITLQVPTEAAIVGLPNTCKLATKRIEAGAQAGTAQGRQKKINEVTVRFLDTLGGKFSPKETGPYETVIFRRASDPMDAPPPPFTGDKVVKWRGGYEQDGIIWYINDQPLPCTIVALIPEVRTNE